MAEKAKAEEKQPQQMQQDMGLLKNFGNMNPALLQNFINAGGNGLMQQLMGNLAGIERPPNSGGALIDDDDDDEEEEDEEDYEPNASDKPHDHTQEDK